MDTELARTFLTVAACGSFQEAAERMHLTQSATSMRVKRLEDRLGCRLFVRSKNGARLTEQGRAFYPHAAEVLRAMHQAENAILAPETEAGLVVVGARFALWQDRLVGAVAEMRSRLGSTRIRMHNGFETELVESLVLGQVSVAVLFTPQSRPGLTIEHLYHDVLRMARHPGPKDDYIAVDWGPDFERHFTMAFPERPAAVLEADVGWLAMQYMQAHGGWAYLPDRLLNSPNAEGFVIDETAPPFHQPVYMVYASAEAEALAGHLDVIRELVASP